MKLLLITLFTIGTYHAAEPTLAELRSYYQLAATQKSAALKLDKLVTVIDTNATSAFIAYKGVNEMMQAKYVLNPLAKLSRFNKGKALLELAVRRDTANVESRFLRFCIQSNLPSFLNYDRELITDKRFLMQYIPRSKDEALKNMIINYFVATNTLTDSELNKIKN